MQWGSHDLIALAALCVVTQTWSDSFRFWQRVCQAKFELLQYTVCQIKSGDCKL